MNDVKRELELTLRKAIDYIIELEARLGERAEATDPQLLTIDDIASLLKVNRRTVADKWIHRPDFPPPRFAPTRAHRLWNKQDILDWAAPKRRKAAQR